jgi:hypothetical protein
LHTKRPLQTHNLVPINFPLKTIKIHHDSISFRSEVKRGRVLSPGLIPPHLLAFSSIALHPRWGVSVLVH